MSQNFIYCCYGYKFSILSSVFYIYIFRNAIHRSDNLFMTISLLRSVNFFNISTDDWEFIAALYFFLFDNNVFDTHINKHWTIEDAPLHFHALIVVVAATANQVAHTNYNNTRAHMDWSFLVNVAVVVCWNWTCVLFRFLSHDFCRQWGSGQRNKWCVRSEKLETNGHLLIVNNWQSFQTWNTIYI